MSEVSAVPLQQALRHLQTAYVNFFAKKGGKPQFKSKKGVQSATFMSNSFRWDGQNLWLAKMVDEEILPLAPVKRTVGIDCGLKQAIILSHGEPVDNPKFFAKDEKRLAKAQRQLTKKQKDSKNQAKARVKVARIYTKITDRRRDWLHKLTTQLIRENQVVCVESLKVKNMVRNHRLAKVIHDVAWGELIRQLSYKAKWYGRTLVEIDQWFPSSKLCHDCGYGF